MGFEELAQKKCAGCGSTDNLVVQQVLDGDDERVFYICAQSAYNEPHNSPEEQPVKLQCLRKALVPVDRYSSTGGVRISRNFLFCVCPSCGGERAQQYEVYTASLHGLCLSCEKEWGEYRAWKKLDKVPVSAKVDVRLPDWTMEKESKDLLVAVADLVSIVPQGEYEGLGHHQPQVEIEAHRKIAMEKFNSELTRLFKHVYEQGKEEGANILQSLATGKVTMADFNKMTAKEGGEG